jgi:hypothetical protein
LCFGCPSNPGGGCRQARQVKAGARVTRWVGLNGWRDKGLHCRSKEGLLDRASKACTRARGVCSGSQCKVRGAKALWGGTGHVTCDRAQATQMLTTPCCHVAALATQIKQTESYELVVTVLSSHARVRRKQCARANCKKGEGTGMIKFQKDRNEFYDTHTECCLRQQ